MSIASCPFDRVRAADGKRLDGRGHAGGGDDDEQDFDQVLASSSRITSRSFLINEEM